MLGMDMPSQLNSHEVLRITHLKSGTWQPVQLLGLFLAGPCLADASFEYPTYEPLKLNMSLHEYISSFEGRQVKNAQLVLVHNQSIRFSKVQCHHWSTSG